MKTRILTVALILGLTSCKKVDEEKPVISIETPANNQHFEPGKTIDLKGKITDNEALSQVKIDMHSGDGHIHKSTKSIFDFEEIIDIEGKGGYTKKEKNERILKHNKIMRTIESITKRK